MSDPALHPALRDLAVLPGDPRYAALRSTYAARGAPAVVLLPGTTDEVATALTWARTKNLPISVRSGGHGRGSTNNGGVLVDLSRLAAVTVADRRLVRVGPGARWADVAATLAPHGLAISSGDHGGVGVGGLATAGGVGWLIRSRGLTIDSVRGVRIVLADGTATWADETTDPDLFWGVRGAGGSLGIVTEFLIEAAAVRDVVHAMFLLGLDRRGVVLRRWSAAQSAAPRELSSTLTVIRQGDRSVGRLEAVAATGDLSRARRLFTALASGRSVLRAEMRILPYAGLLPPSRHHAAMAEFSTVNGFLGTLTDASAGAVMAASAAPGGPLIQLRSVGGAVHDVPAGATAFAHRGAEVLAVASVMAPAGPAGLRSAWERVRPHTSGSYANLTTEHPFDTIYPGATGTRLTALRARIDPEGVFR
ncbi:FAD-binding oxidoreductase [Catenuloplanes japonicus]|uniref:FAD-binding oxidoreductase n=1 Tax=Catenuloplanes japonicus TaxID=33876 RepID=UPI000B2626F1|nr:FAD-binding oxidoreductase [Catenuloplanes japonicus]